MTRITNAFFASPDPIVLNIHESLELTDSCLFIPVVPRVFSRPRLAKARQTWLVYKTVQAVIKMYRPQRRK